MDSIYKLVITWFNVHLEIMKYSPTLFLPGGTIITKIFTKKVIKHYFLVKDYEKIIIHNLSKDNHGFFGKRVNYITKKVWVLNRNQKPITIQK